ncbi:MAG: helix-turn-helix domain-containing protein [Lapillicoccus sp.]
MVKGVSRQQPETDLRAARRADTEERLLTAAEELFVRDGYTGTTLAAVAARAGVSARTVYVRFGTKAALLKRLIDVTIGGDTQDLDVTERAWFQTALTAPTLPERIAAIATGGRQLMERTADVMAVAQQAEPMEPLIAAAAQAGREATRDGIRHLCQRAADDGLLPAGTDVTWLGDTLGLLAGPDAYQLIVRTHGWDPDAYQAWYEETWTRLTRAAMPGAGSPNDETAGT